MSLLLQFKQHHSNLKQGFTTSRCVVSTFMSLRDAGVFVYGYCLYYYTARSEMSGFMQGSFFFGYMAVVCFGFFLMLGTVGWRASLMFVRHIYKVHGF